MYKQVIVVVVLSIIIALVQPYVTDLVQAYLGVHDWINNLLTYVIAGGKIGNYITSVLSFLILPFLVGLIVALVYYIIKKSFVPWFMVVVWICWLVLTTALVMR